MSRMALEALSKINIRGGLKDVDKVTIQLITRSTTRALCYMENNVEETDKYNSIKLYYRTIDMICETMLHTDFSEDCFVSGALLVCSEIHDKYSV